MKSETQLTTMPSTTDSTTSAETPMPYKENAWLRLEVTKSYEDWPFATRPVVCPRVAGVYSVTTSPVLRVSLVALDENSGQKIYHQAVLKLFDRRFGKNRRDRLENRHLVPHTAQREADFQSFVRQGSMPSFLHRLADANNNPANPVGIRPWHFLDERLDMSDADRHAQYEAAVWAECDEDFNRETEAYETLHDLQGKLIPRMHAHVRLALSDAPPDLLDNPETAPYVTVKGILLEWIPGCLLDELHNSSSMAPSSAEEWRDIVQATVDAAHEIETRGILNQSCSPHNVVVHRDTRKPFMIDFANSNFKEKLVRGWRENGYLGDDDDPDEAYWGQVVATNNACAMGKLMKKRLRLLKGIELDIKVPDEEKILEDIKRRGANRSISEEAADTTGLT